MDRRSFTKGISVVGLASLTPIPALPAAPKIIYRAIPKTGEKIPVIGMGSWLTFDVMGNPAGMRNMKNVLKTFYEKGGRVLDSSPMYGTSEKVIGQLAGELGIEEDLWISTKVWTHGRENGLRQIQQSHDQFHHRVMVNHVHNIRDFKTHLTSLREARDSGKIQYIGVTHYLNSSHDQLAAIIGTGDVDFVQFNYNIENIGAADRLIPTARDHGVATIINRPFQGGRLFNMVNRTPVAEWQKEMEIDNWASCFLKYIIAEEAITCVVPATTQVPHVLENMKAGTGNLPDPAQRDRLRKYFLSVI